MRRSYFDEPLPPNSGGILPEWRHTPPAAPFDPPQAEPAAEANTPDHTSPFRRPPKQKKASGRAKRAFALSLSLILLLSGAGVGYRLSLGDGLHDFFPGLWTFSVPEVPQWNEWVEELDTPAPQTSAPRAPLERQTLRLAPLSDSALSPQEIYRKASPAIVGVRAFLDNGVALGTGVVMTRDGYIITNAHVITGGSSLEVVFSNGQQLEALLVGYDEGTDLAVLKTEPQSPLTAADFGDSSGLTVGDTAYAIGNPLGEELWGTMTDGIISAIDRPVATDTGSMTLIQTTAALNPGNSGGALVNAAGQVVGITNMKMASSSQPIEGLGFAIPTASVKPVVEQLTAFGRYLGTPMLGITVQNALTADGEAAGALIVEVEAGSGAQETELLPGDIIVWANGYNVTDVDWLSLAKTGLLPGDALEVECLRDGERFRTTVTLGPQFPTEE